MKILFLDIDGVLNSECWFKTRPRGGIRTPEQRWQRDLDPTAIAWLNRIVAETDCNVVISSTWRKHMTVLQIVEALLARGLNKDHTDKFGGMTPVLNRERGYEIQLWLDGMPDVDFAILDDDDDMLHLLPRLARCNPQFGLTAMEAGKAVRLLS